jgi:hypothetical protein
MKPVNVGVVNAPSIHTPCCVCGSTETRMMCVCFAGRVYCLECGRRERARLFMAEGVTNDTVRLSSAVTAAERERVGENLLTGVV